MGADLRRWRSDGSFFCVHLRHLRIRPLTTSEIRPPTSLAHPLMFARRETSSSADGRRFSRWRTDGSFFCVHLRHLRIRAFLHQGVTVLPASRLRTETQELSRRICD